MGNIINKINGWTDRYRGILLIIGLLGLLPISISSLLKKILQYLFGRVFNMPTFITPSIIIIELIIILMFYLLLIRKDKIIKGLRNIENLPLIIYSIGDKISQPISGGKLIKKWEIESNDLYKIVQKRHIKAYNPEMSTIMNEPSDNIDLYLDTYTEFNETYLDVLLRWMFKPKDIRDFERKISIGKLKKYILK